MPPLSSSTSMQGTRFWAGFGIGITIGFGAGLLMLGLTGGEKAAREETGAVRGTVTFRGEPVAEGMVNIYNPVTAQANHGEIKDGYFRLAGQTPIGTYIVYVTPIPPPPSEALARRDSSAEVAEENFPPIPTKYQTQAESDLKIEVVPGCNDVAIEIP